MLMVDKVCFENTVDQAQLAFKKPADQDLNVSTLLVKYMESCKLVEYKMTMCV